MKLTINGLQFKKQCSGIGVMIREIYNILDQNEQYNITMVINKNSPELSATPKTKLVRTNFNYEQSLQRMFFQTFILGLNYSNESILLTSDSKIPFLLKKSAKIVPIITDLAIYKMPETYQLSRVFWWKLQYQYLKKVAVHYIAISESTKQDIIECLDIPEEKISVIPCAANEKYRPVHDEVDKKRIKDKYQIPESFLLFVGNFNPRKNLKRIFLAYDMVKEKGIRHKLVVAGEYGWKFDQDKELSTIKEKDSILFLGFVPDEDMPCLYSMADLFLFPTLYEGFGIPIIEAQQCGTAVLTSQSSSMPEVTGDSAVLVNPYDEKEIAKGILAVVTNPVFKEELIKKGLENQKRYSWDMSVNKLESVLGELDNNG